jgi:hypothetical protein
MIPAPALDHFDDEIRQLGRFAQQAANDRLKGIDQSTSRSKIIFAASLDNLDNVTVFEPTIEWDEDKPHNIVARIEIEYQKFCRKETRTFVVKCYKENDRYAPIYEESPDMPVLDDWFRAQVRDFAMEYINQHLQEIAFRKMIRWKLHEALTVLSTT